MYVRGVCTYWPERRNKRNPTTSTRLLRFRLLLSLLSNFNIAGRHLHIPHNCYLIAFHWVSSGYMCIISAQPVSLPTSEWSTPSGIKAMASRHVIIAPDQISKSILSGFNSAKRHPRKSSGTALYRHAMHVD